MSWTRLALTVAEQEDGGGWPLTIAMAEAAVESVGSPLRLQADLEGARGLRALRAHDLRGAQELFSRSIELAERAMPLAAQRLATSLASRAEVEILQGDAESARSDLDRVVAMGSALGERSPRLLDATFERAIIDLEAGRLDDAERSFQEALDGYLEVFGPEYSGRVHARLGLVAVSLGRGDKEQARSLASEALTDSAPGTRHWALDALASVEV
ncbi:MAG: tetratricopeptide repeat protein, partial [Myxococcales bacterium]|nr:tetratricopeptide repeat protein [Myxococcales bacterium]